MPCFDFVLRLGVLPHYDYRAAEGSTLFAVRIEHFGPAASSRAAYDGPDWSTDRDAAAAHLGYIASVTPTDLNSAIDFWLIVVRHRIRK